MLCCVSKKALSGVSLGTADDYYPKSASTVMVNKVERIAGRVEFEARLKEDEPAILLPCAICARTFTPQSLEKHVKICERATTKKRKPFDSAKQRIQGTDLAEFLPKQEKKPRYYYEDKSTKPTASWKQSHNDFLRVIRAARDNLGETHTEKQTASSVTASTRGPIRANEKGVCPTCSRHFGVKAYDRHVAWCKERSTRLPISQGTNVARERLEARMKYRAPVLKNRRVTNREKYSPGSTMTSNQTSKVALSAPNNVRSIESASNTNSNKTTHVLTKQKSPLIRRSGQQQSPLGRTKSLGVDRTNKPIGGRNTGSASNRVLRPVFPLNHAPFFPDFHTNPEEKRYTAAECERYIVSTPSEKCTARLKVNALESSGYEVKTGERKNLQGASPRRFNIVFTRSQGKPKLNDVTVNYRITSMAIQPYTVSKDDDFVSSEQIVRERNQVKVDITKNNTICKDLQATTVETLPDDNIKRFFGYRRKATQYNKMNNGMREKKNLSSIQMEVAKGKNTICAGRSSETKWNPVQVNLRADTHLTNPQSSFACYEDLDNFNCHTNFHVNNTYVNDIIVAEQADTAVNDYVCAFDDIVESNLSTMEIPKERKCNNTLFAHKGRKMSEELKIRHEYKLKQLGRFEEEPSWPTLEFLDMSLGSFINEIVQNNGNKCHEVLLDECSQKNEHSIQKLSMKKVVVSEEKHNNINSLDKHGKRPPRDHRERRNKRWWNKTNFSVGSIFITDMQLNIFEFTSVNVISQEITISQTGNNNKQPLVDVNDKLWSKDSTLSKSDRERGNLIIIVVVKVSNLTSNNNRYLVAIAGDTKTSSSTRRHQHKFHTQGVKCRLKIYRHLKTFALGEENYKGEINTKAFFVTNYHGQKRVVLSKLHKASHRSIDKKYTDSRLIKKISIQEQRTIDYSGGPDETLFFIPFVEHFVNCTLLTIISEKIRSIPSKSLTSVEDEMNYTITGSRMSDKKTERRELNGRCIDHNSLFLANKRTKRGGNIYNLQTPSRNMKNKLFKDDYLQYIYKASSGVNNRQLYSQNLKTYNNSSFHQGLYAPNFAKSFLFQHLVMINVDHFVKPNVNVQFNFFQNNEPRDRKTNAMIVRNFDYSPVNNIDKENTTKAVKGMRWWQIPSTGHRELTKIFNDNIEKYNFHSRTDGCRDRAIDDLESVLFSKNKNKKHCFPHLFEGNERFRDMCNCCPRTNENNNILYQNKRPNIYMSNSKIMSSIKVPDISTAKDNREINKENLKQYFVYGSGSGLKEEWPLNTKNVKCQRFIETAIARLQKNMYDTRCLGTNIETNEISKVFLGSNAIIDINNLPVGLNSSGMRRKLRHSMSLLRTSTNTLVSSTQAIDVTNKRKDRPTQESYENETIQQIIVGESRTIGFVGLPKIKVDSQFEAGHECSFVTSNLACSKMATISLKKRLINLKQLHQRPINHFKKNFKLPTLPQVLCNTVMKRASGTHKEYDPFLLAEQQMNELLSDTSGFTSDGSTISKTRKGLFPLSHSSAFVKYPSQEVTRPATATITATTTIPTNTRTSVIAPPTEFDDRISDISSDSTGTNSLSHETFLKELKDFKGLPEFDKIYNEVKNECKTRSPTKELSRRVIVDKSEVLGNDIVKDPSHGSKSFVESTERARKIFDKVSAKVVRPAAVNRSNPTRVSSAPKPSTNRKVTEAVTSNTSNTFGSTFHETQSYRNGNLNSDNNNDVSLSASNLSLSSIMSSEIDIKRSNSVFNDLISSFDDNLSPFPSLEQRVKNNSILVSSPVHDSRSTHNRQISDEELSSPDSFKRQDHGKFSADSAYSSLNRKCSNHVRSAIDVDENVNEETRSKINYRRASDTSEAVKCKMSNFCHECGSKFPKTAKYCCECGMKRLIL